MHCTLSPHTNLWFGCTEMRRLVILTALQVRTQETIQTSQREDTFLVLPVMHTDPWLSQGAWWSAYRFMRFC